MTCTEGVFATWEESPENQAGVHYPFPTVVGNRCEPGNGYSAASASGGGPWRTGSAWAAASGRRTRNQAA